MSFAKKIAVAVNLNEPLSEILESMKSLDFINKSEVHFLNIYLTTTYAIGLGESAIIYPLETDQKKIREQTLERLDELGRSFLPKEFSGKIVSECLFSDDPKRKFCEYISEKGIDTVIVAAREKRGIFESSFTQFISKHTKANMLILKHKI